MNPIPVFDIEHFHYRGIGKTFYANTLQAHLPEHSFTLSDHSYITTSHGHDFYSTVLITKGTGTHTLDFSSYPVKPGYVFLMHPGQVHKWELSCDIEGYIIFHTKDFYNDYFTYERVEEFLFFGAGNSPLVILNSTTYNKIEPVFCGMLTEYENEQVTGPQKICSLLNLLYIELSESYLPYQEQPNKNANQRRQVRQLENFINSNYKSFKFPKEYAEMMNMSQKHLNRIVRLNLNKTTSALISERTILEAKRMLAHSAFSISQIAFELGYTEVGYFFRFFKKKSGETPNGFMNRCRKN